MLYSILKHTHSGLRWFVLIFLLGAIIISIVNMVSKKEDSSIERKFGLFAMAFTHTQILIGLILYFISSKVIFSAESMKSDLLRFFLVEHVGMMLVALVLVTIGYSKAKKASSIEQKRKRIAIFYGIALLVILLAIPWPWQQLAAAWF